MSDSEPVILTGTHLVEVVLRHGRRKPRELAVLRGGSARGLARLVKLAEQKDVPVRWVEVPEMRTLAGEPSDAALTLCERESPELSDVLPAPDAPALVLALEGVEDPHNVGEILRTAFAAGADAVLLEEHARTLPRDVVARSSAGASECLATVFTGDLAGALAVLGQNSIAVAAAVPEGGDDLFHAKLGRRVALVVGGEHRGLSRRTLEACDRRVTIPMSGAVQSLGAVSGAAVMLFEVVRRRGAR